jgi:hypothetical protein
MMVNFVMADEDVDFLLPRPESIIGSDGWSTTPGGPTGGAISACLGRRATSRENAASNRPLGGR